ncbi:MAG: aminotransferase class V-fold PLP-dependent enzyme [Candidatus Eisenbacteria bacterium]
MTPTRPSLPLDPSPAELERWLATTTAFVVDHVARLADMPSFATEGAPAATAALLEPPPEEGRSLEDALALLKPAIEASFTTAGPGYLAFIPGGGIPSAGIADLVGCITNRFVNVTAAAPSLARLEGLTLSWLAELMGFPPSAGGIFTTGGSLSNLAAIVAAREAKLGEEFHDGVMYFSEQTHASVAKAARLAGFPRRALRPIPVDARLRMDADLLDAAIRADRAAGRRPFLVVANAGTTNTGAVDPLARIVEIGRAHDLWVHADGAYGGFFRLVPEGARILAGIEECDSMTLDPHKTLFLPYGTGVLLVRDPATLERAHATEASYLQDVAAAAGQTNFTDLSPELSRDLRGLRVWLPFVVHGIAAFRAQLAEKLALTRHAAERIAAEPLFQLIDRPQLSIVAFVARPPAGDPDQFGEEVLRRVNARRRVFLSSTRHEGRYVLRICTVSFRTHQDRVDEAVDALIEEARALAAGLPESNAT